MPRKLSYYPEINYGITSLERIDFDLTIAASTVTVIESSSEPTSNLFALVIAAVWKLRAMGAAERVGGG